VSAIATLLIRRGAPGEPAREESWDVPFEPGQSVLDALRWIRAQRDPTLAIRYSCTNANSCKECMVRIEGRTVYACIERLRRWLRLARKLVWGGWCTRARLVSTDTSQTRRRTKTHLESRRIRTSARNSKANKPWCAKSGTLDWILEFFGPRGFTALVVRAPRNCYAQSEKGVSST
jgi:hypothetical protein